MSLLLATLLPGLLLLALGGLLLVSSTAIIAAFRAFPRSPVAAVICFGSGAVWFLGNLLYLSTADFGDFRYYFFAGFTVVALLSFKFAPDFLAVRGLAALMLLVAKPLLDAGYLNFEHWQINFYKAAVYVGIVLAIWLGAQPWRMRDFLTWLFEPTTRARALGGLLVAYGLLLAVVAFTY